MTLDEIIARTEARRKAGANQTYPQHAGKGAATGGLTPPTAATPKRVPLPCAHEGAVIEACLSCRGEARSVRQCFHPDGERDRCTREYVSDKVQACDRCPDYRAAGVSG